jgi:Mn-dependent DtxR family transcriptional regulator
VSRKPASTSAAPETAKYTPLQGQYLAFIYAYTTIHRMPPAEADMQAFFRVSPPSIHQMVVHLERLGLIRRTPRVARSIELLVPPSTLPLLESR